MKKLIDQLKHASEKEVTIIGDVMLDEYIFGRVERISPEAPVPVLRETEREWSLGGAANVAVNCRHIGCEVHLIGVVGTDDEGKKLCDLLVQAGISTDGIIISEKRKTTCKRRLMATHQQLLRIDSEDIAPLLSSERKQLRSHLDTTIPSSGLILISDYVKGVIDKALIGEVLARAAAYNCPVFADPKGPRFEKYHGIHYLKPNRKEFDQMVDVFNLNQSTSLVENGRQICDRLDLQGIIITLGAEGIQFVSHDEAIHAPAIKREVFDLTGAGDTVFAFLALGMLRGFQMQQCLKLANHAAAVAISHLKTYAVSLDELIDKQIETSEKYIQDWAMLKIELDWLRIENKRVVFTNGCFDLLHSGHVHLLREAKKRGDILVVALNDDNSVRRLKGSGRPTKSLEERVAIMGAIGSVDFVTSFGDETPQCLIDYLKPDVLIKGGDYKAEEIVGYKTLKSYGGEVGIIAYQKGHSTTRLIDKLLKRSKQPAI